MPRGSGGLLIEFVRQTGSGGAGTLPGSRRLAKRPVLRGRPASWRVTPGRLVVLAGVLVGGLLAFAPAPDRPAGVEDPQPVGGRSHMVAPGDTLQSLADRYYGDSREWRRIFVANRQNLADQGKLVPGSQLRIPEE